MGLITLVPTFKLKLELLTLILILTIAVAIPFATILVPAIKVVIQVLLL